MVGEFIAGLGIFKTMFDTARGLTPFFYESTFPTKKGQLFAGDRSRHQFLSGDCEYRKSFRSTTLCFSSSTDPRHDFCSRIRNFGSWRSDNKILIASSTLRV
jgi:hypothetical protein